MKTDQKTFDLKWWLYFLYLFQSGFKKKVDQQLLECHQLHNQHQQQQQQLHQHHPSYFLWEQYNVTLFKSANYGYGIAISGGVCSTNQDPLIHISDIVPGGPAESKLM
jgi:hypothetical protein